MTNFTETNPDGEDAINLDSSSKAVKVPADWQPYLLAGATILSVQELTGTSDLPSDVDFVWDKNIWFNNVQRYRAIYIIRPRFAGMMALAQEERGWIGEPLIVGVSGKVAGYVAFKMSRVIFETP